MSDERARAPSSCSSATPSRTARVSGGSTNGKVTTSSGALTTPTATICRITLASDVRRISGSVNRGRASKSSREYSRIATPSASRPQRPERWLAEACEIGSMGSRCTLAVFEYRLMRAVPGSTT